jgi:hypothetical protein
MSLSMTRKAILSRINTYAGSAAARGLSARADVLALADGVPANEFLTMVTAEISHHRLGKVMPTVDRMAIVAALSDKARVGGRIKGNVIAETLGVVPSTITIDLKAIRAEAEAEAGESPVKAEPTQAEIDAKIVKRLESLKTQIVKIREEIGANATTEMIIVAGMIEAEISKITN